VVGLPPEDFRMPSQPKLGRVWHLLFGSFTCDST
jgi:hypothetical protein